MRIHITLRPPASSPPFWECGPKTGSRHVLHATRWIADHPLDIVPRTAKSTGLCMVQTFFFSERRGDFCVLSYSPSDIRLGKRLSELGSSPGKGLSSDFAHSRPCICVQRGAATKKPSRHCRQGEEFWNKVWLRGKDLNLRPLGYEPNELPDCSTPRADTNKWSL